MSEKPGDFFLGVIDFFGILVPGIALLALQGSTLAHLTAIPLPRRRELVGLGSCPGCGLCDRPLSHRFGRIFESPASCGLSGRQGSLLSRSTESSSGPTRGHPHPLGGLPRRLPLHPDCERQCPRGGRAPSGRIQALSQPYPALPDRRPTVSSHRLLVRPPAGG